MQSSLFLLPSLFFSPTHYSKIFLSKVAITSVSLTLARFFKWMRLRTCGRRETGLLSTVHLYERSQINLRIHAMFVIIIIDTWPRIRLVILHLLKKKPKKRGKMPSPILGTRLEYDRASINPFYLI